MESAIGVILKTKEGRFLLQWRDNKKEIFAPNKFSLFGGSIEENESPEKAVVREMEEELELKIDEKDLRLVHTTKLKSYTNYIFLYEKPVEQNQLKLHEGQAIVSLTRFQTIFHRRTCWETRWFFMMHNPKLRLIQISAASSDVTIPPSQKEI